MAGGIQNLKSIADVMYTLPPQRTYAVKILENVPLNSVVATLITNRPSDRRVNFSVRESSLPGKEFAVNQGWCDPSSLVVSKFHDLTS